ARSTSAWLRSRPTTSTPSRPTTTPRATIAAVTSPSPSRRCPQDASPSRDGHLLAAQQHVAARADVDRVDADAAGAGPDRHNRVEPVGGAVAEPGEVAALAVGGQRLHAAPVAVDVHADRVGRLGVHGPPADAHAPAADRLDPVDVAGRVAVPGHPSPADHGVAAGPLVDGEDGDVARAGRDAQAGVEAVPAAAPEPGGDVGPVEVGGQAGQAAP